MPTKTRKVDVFKRPSTSHPLLADLPNHTLEDILKLKDPFEATASEKAALLVAKLIYPADLDTFYREHWEKQPLLASHYAEANTKKPPTTASYYLGKLPTRKALRAMLSAHVLQSADLLVEGVELDGEVQGSEVWAKYSDSHAIHLLQPAVRDDQLWMLASALEEAGPGRVDIQLLLLPAACPAQAEAAEAEHDCFLVQLEGRSGWTAGRGDGPPLTCSLSPADVLYVPSGCALKREVCEQGVVLRVMLPKRHQRIADLLLLALPQAIALASASTSSSSSSLPKIAKGLPSHCSRLLGIAAADGEEDGERAALLREAGRCLSLVTAACIDLLDPASDQMKKHFIAERMPVCLTEDEEARTAAGAPDARLLPYTKLRMLRPGIATAVVEDGKVVVYHCMDNARELYGAALNPLEFELDDGPCIEGLLLAYPEPVAISDLEHPAEDIEDKVAVAEALYKEGFLVIADELSHDAEQAAGDDDGDDDPF